MALLAIPTASEKKALIDGMNKDIASYTVFDERTNCHLPVICCVCDSIPKKANWWTTCPVTELEKILRRCHMHRSLLGEYYPELLLNQYTADHETLKPFLLSPETYVNSNEETIICKECLANLRTMNKRKSDRRHPPMESIANGYVIGDAPDCLTDLTQTEVSLISRTRTFVQSWVFFGGCHQHIKGWHTFFKNRSTDNVGNLLMLTESGLKGLILVVLCGPFTETQKAFTLDQISVDPLKVIAAWRWLKANNYRYRNDTIPHIDDIPLPKVIEENA
jgi:hypothetical protein